METGRKPTVGALAHAGQVDVRIAAKGATPEEAEIRSRLGDARFGAGEATLEGEIARRTAALGVAVLPPA